MAPSNDISPETILRAQPGDSKALEAVLQACQPVLEKMARKLLRYGQGEIEPLVNAGRMGVFNAVRNYNADKGTFLAFAYRHAQFRMIDELGRQLGLSADARKAYLEVLQARKRLLQEGRAPTSAEIAEASGVTRGLVEQIMRVLFQPTISLNELVEDNPDWNPGTPVGTADPSLSPEELLMETEDAVAQRQTIQAVCVACLGPVEAARLLVLTILREGGEDYEYSWEWIAASLEGRRQPPYPDWEKTVTVKFSGWTCLPQTWAEVQQLFLRCDRYPTAAALRQRYSNALSRLSQSKGTR